MSDIDEVRKILGQMGNSKLRERGRTGYPYIGYEDYSPQGQAAIDAFNKAGGPNNMGYGADRNPNEMRNYLAAILKAKEAAEMNMRFQEEERNKGSQSMEELLGNITVPQVPLEYYKYQYPPKR